MNIWKTFSPKGFKKKNLNKLTGKKILVNAGPTFEAIDPVRYIGNHSSGKMGYAIACKLASHGAEVILVSGPVALPKPEGIKFIQVTSADEMYKECYKHFPKCQGAILAAAVSDYKPYKVAKEKIKGKDSSITLELKPNIDIALELGKIKTERQFLIGFALETNDEIKNAKGKLIRKNLDFIVLNSLKHKGAGFKSDTNKISIIEKNNKITEFELKPKQDVAEDIINKLIAYL